MDDRTAREIRYARLLCRYGRIFCVAIGVIFGMIGLVGVCVALLGSQAGGMGIDVGSYVLRGEALVSTAARLWALCVVVAMFGLLFAGLRFMFMLFGNLERGAIFTNANVKLLRNLAWVALTGAALQGVIPLTSQLLKVWNVIDVAQPRTLGDHSLGLHLVPGSIITALLLWLASWIMDIGRRTRDEAEQLRRDADLVI